MTVDNIAGWCRNEGAELKRLHDAGHPFAAHEALLLCRECDQPLPSWAVEALLDASARHAAGLPHKAKGMGRTPSAVKWWRARLVDLTRWEAVEEVLRIKHALRPENVHAGRKKNARIVAMRKAAGKNLTDAACMASEILGGRGRGVGLPVALLDPAPSLTCAACGTPEMILKSYYSVQAAHRRGEGAAWTPLHRTIADFEARGLF